MPAGQSVSPVASSGAWRPLLGGGLARLLLIGLLSLPHLGCNAVLLLGYLIGGPPSIEPDFDKQTGESLAGKEKRGGKEKKVLVLCFAPRELKWDNEAIDLELAKHVAVRLLMNDIKVADPDRVHNWLDKNPDWDKPDQVGAAFDVNYVVFIDLGEYSLFEEHSSNLYRGRAAGTVSVVKMDEDKKKGSVIYTKPITSRFPTSAPVSEDQFPYDQFKKLYLSRLSEEIGVLFFEHYAGDDIPARALL